MTKIQLNKAIAIVKKDATITQHYVSDDGDMCVIGGLAVHTGFSKKKLLKVNTTSIHGKNNKVIIELRDHLFKKFNLHGDQLGDLQLINDEEEVIAQRRKKLIARLKEFYGATNSR